LNYYYLFDFFFVLSTLFLSYLAYKHRIYIKLFEYFRIFFLIAISAKLASKMAFLLQKIHFLNADSYAIAVFIGFLINLILFFAFYELVLSFINKFINASSIKLFFAKLLTLFEITVLCTFGLFLVMQIHLIKYYAKEPLQKTFTYPYIKTFYTQFLNDDFIYAILNTDTKTNHKELIFRSFKNSF